MLWKHGFASVWFAGFCSPFFLRLMRCRDCHKNFRFRPSSHFSRFQNSTESIRSALKTRFSTGKWLKILSKWLQKTWYYRLKNQFKFILGVNLSDPLSGFEKLYLMLIVPVSRSPNVRIRLINCHSNEGNLL
jgi:hypothetical protein